MQSKGASQDNEAIIRAGRLAQLVRASALHAEGRGFEPLIAHHICAKFLHNAKIAESLTGWSSDIISDDTLFIRYDHSLDSGKLLRRYFETNFLYGFS